MFLTKIGSYTLKLPLNYLCGSFPSFLVIFGYLASSSSFSMATLSYFCGENLGQSYGDLFFGSRFGYFRSY